MQSISFEEWTTIATIVLSVVAIGIAIWSSRSTSRAANKQIDELKRLCASQTDTINRLKQLSELQIDTTIKQLEAEIQKMMAEVKKASKESQEIADIYRGGEQLGAEFRERMMRKYQETKAQRDLQIYSECTRNLNEILNELNKLKQKLG